MREIKFRAWDKSFKKMVTNFLMPGSSGEFGMCRMAVSFSGEIFNFTDWDMADYEEDEMRNSSCYVDRFELMQFIERHDKDSKEIYHYDILQNSMGRRWVVDWRCDEKYCGWDLRIINSDIPHCIGETYKDFKIVGNIHENPELLKEAK